MVKRSEIVDLRGLWLEGHGLSVGSETLGLSSRVQGAAQSLQMQSDEPVVSSYRLAKTATLTVLPTALRHGRSGRLGGATAGLHGLLRLHLKAWGCPSHS